MAQEIRRVEHYSTSIPNKIGEGTRVLDAIRNTGVNLIAVWGYPYGVGRAQLEFIPENGPAFVAAAKKAKLKLRKGTAFYVSGDDRTGVIADILKKLADAGISVGAVQAVCSGGGRFGAVVFVSTANAQKAAAALGIA